MRKVITYGTFDLFHRGHYNILKRAKEEGDYLIVGITGECYDSERGKLSVQDSLATRVANVQKTGFADQIIIEEYLGQKILDILRYDVDVLVIGSDWRGKFDHLQKYCEVKYLERTKDISSTQLREETMRIYRFGAVMDALNDYKIMDEAERVSSIHAECVFCENGALAEQFAQKKELHKGYGDYDAFLSSVDIVYIGGVDNQYAYIERALKAGKHVVCDAPFTLDIDKKLELYRLASENKLVLLENISTLYLQAFEPLLWMVHSNQIGSIQSVKFSISKKHIENKPIKDFFAVAYYPLCVLLKLMGTDYEDWHFKLVKDDKEEISYALITVSYPNAVASIEISMDYELDDGLHLLGSTGHIHVPNNWWDLGYFTIKKHKEAHPKHYSYNFEGSGFRYLIRDLLMGINSEKSKLFNIDEKEHRALTAILKAIDDKK